MFCRRRTWTWETISQGISATSIYRQYDLIVNMSGAGLPKTIGVPVEEWKVDDPMGGTEDDFRAAREAIEMLVMRLILRARLGKL